jgi:hypothetical protein
MARREFKWTNHQLDKLNKVKDILDELNEYKPLTLRQVYYQLVGKGYIENKVSQYGMLSNLLKWARIDGHIPWSDIEDRVRAYHDLTGWHTPESFINHEVNIFLQDYKRDLLQSQNKYIEIWIEKDALSSIFIRAAEPYGIPVVVCRGFSSVSFLNDYCERLKYYKNKQATLLYFGDFDPSGMEMLESMQITLEQELGISGIVFKRVALSKDDIFNYGLPHSPDALKKTDSRANKHLKTYGDLAVELDALRPDVLTGKIKEAINNELDIDKFNREVDQHYLDLEKIAAIKNKVMAAVDHRTE